MDLDVATLNTQMEREALTVKRIEAELRKVIVGQDYLLDRLLVALLARGHVLIEGVPGLAKTLAVKTLAQTLDIRFHRIQFTPDLLPADLVGTLIYDQRTGEFLPRIGPVFTPLALRGRGYGSAVTAAAANLARRGGVDEVVLFADLANPTSNGIYQRIGFEAVADSV